MTDLAPYIGSGTLLFLCIAVALHEFHLFRIRDERRKARSEGYGDGYQKGYEDARLRFQPGYGIHEMHFEDGELDQIEKALDNLAGSRGRITSLPRRVVEKLRHDQKVLRDAGLTGRHAPDDLHG